MVKLVRRRFFCSKTDGLSRHLITPVPLFSKEGLGELSFPNADKHHRHKTKKHSVPHTLCFFEFHKLKLKYFYKSKSNDHDPRVPRVVGTSKDRLWTK